MFLFGLIAGIILGSLCTALALSMMRDLQDLSDASNRE
jgi:hypothetical protein